THDRRERLRVLLDSLDRQTASPQTFEVVVVVDGSTDGTEAMLGALSPSFRLHVVTQERSGVETARNNGVDVAQGRLCLFVDDDIRADPKLVAEPLGAQPPEGGIVGIGRVTTLSGHERPRWARYRSLERDDFFGRLDRAAPTYLDCHGGNLCVPRD